MNSLMTRGSLLNDFFKDMSPGFFIRPLHGEALPDPGQIRIDVKESDDAYIVRANVPGVSKDEIQVSLDGDVVMLRAEVKQEDAQTQDGRVLCSERYFGSVTRSFQLPQEVDETQSKAKYENGVLTLTLPKKQGGGAQQIKIE